MARIGALVALFVLLVIPLWLLSHYIFGRSKERRKARRRQRVAELLQTLNDDFDLIESRLRRIESFVTSDDFSLQQKTSSSRPTSNE